MAYPKGTYLITGITGYIGRMLASALADSDEYRQGGITLIGVVRNREKAEKILSQVMADIRFIEADCREEENLRRQVCMPVDYVIHCAAVTESSAMVRNPVETADSIVLGTRNMLELTRSLQVKSIVYLSSMEVYGKVSDSGRRRTEKELGDISLEQARSCYSMGKRMAEHYCHIYRQEYGLPVKIARLAQVFGKGVRFTDNRVYMQFARAVCEGRDIVLRTSGVSMGNYCAVEDAVRAVFLILENGRDGEVYNVVNEENTMRIREMAELVAMKAADGRIQVKIEEEDIRITGYAPDTGLRLSGKKLRGLGWKPEKGLLRMYQDMIEELKASAMSQSK